MARTNTLNPSLRRIRPPEPGGVPRNIPAADLSPSVPSRFGTEQGQWVRMAGATEPPQGAVNVDVPGDLVLAPGGSGVLVTITVPDQFRLRINGIGFHAGDPAGLRFLTWQVQSNGIAIPGYTSQVAAVGSFRLTSPEFIVRGYSETVNLVGFSAANAVISYTFAARVRGWFYQDKEG